MQKTELKEKIRTRNTAFYVNAMDQAGNFGVLGLKKTVYEELAEKEVIESTPDNSTTENNEGSGNVENTFKEVIIKTNIRCEKGKKKIETMLRNTDGVISAMIDNDNGNLYLSQENSDVRNKVIEIVRQNGFEADTKKPTKSIPDPCK